MNRDVCPHCGTRLTHSQARNEYIRSYCAECGRYERIETSFDRPWLSEPDKARIAEQEKK